MVLAVNNTKVKKFVYNSPHGKVYLSAPDVETLVKTLEGFGYKDIDMSKISAAEHDYPEYLNG